MACSGVVPSTCFLLQIIFYSSVIETTLLCENTAGGFLKLVKTYWWSNEKTKMKLGYPKKTWAVSVSLASATNWSARHRQIAIFRSTYSHIFVKYFDNIRWSWRRNLKWTPDSTELEVVTVKIKCTCTFNLIISTFSWLSHVASNVFILGHNCSHFL